MGCVSLPALQAAAPAKVLVGSEQDLGTCIALLCSAQEPGCRPAQHRVYVSVQRAPRALPLVLHLLCLVGQHLQGLLGLTCDVTGPKPLATVVHWQDINC